MAGYIENKNGYYPYGEPWREPAGQPYLFGGKERLRDNALNEYDFSARRLQSSLCLWTAPDPLATDYAPTSPYAYCAANPIKFTDPTGQAAIIFGGVIIGYDGYDDKKMLIIPDVKKDYKEGNESISGVGLSKSATDELVKFVKKHSGDSEAFKNNKTFNEVAVEIVSDKKSVEDMNAEVSKDNGKGGDSNANNREYGGYFTENGFKAETPGNVSSPENGGANISMRQNVSSVHSHPSGKVKKVLENGATATYRYIQIPSTTDISNKNGATVHYVIGRGDGNIYIYNSQGVISKMKYKKFLNLYGIK